MHQCGAGWCRRTEAALLNGLLFLMFLVVLNDLSNDEIQEILGEFRVQIGLLRKIFKTCDLFRFAIRIGRGKVVCGLEPAHRLGVLEPLAQGVNEDCVQPVDAVAVFLQEFRGAGHMVSQGPILSV